MRVLLREKPRAPIYVAPGDILELVYTAPNGHETVVAKRQIKKAAVFGEGILFELEPGDIPGVDIEYGLGGAFVKLKGAER